MHEQKTTATIALAFKDAPPQKLDAGAQLTFSILPKWPEGFVRGGATYAVQSGGETVEAGELPWSEAEDGSIVFALKAPETAGAHHWTVVIAAGAADESQAAGSLPFTFTTLPHATSLAVWDNPSPIVRRRSFEVKVGAKCTSSCALAGTTVEIRDETDTVVGTGVVGGETWEKTASLYWTTVALKAPRKLGLNTWTAGFATAGTKLPHDGTIARFSFVTVAEPAHAVSVKVIDKATKAPVAGAQVRLGLYRATTDEKGAAKVAVPKGEFPLIVTHARFKETERTLAVSKDMRLRIGAEALPEEDPFARWTA